jgi:phosphatidylserine/phosphatidylglycerophosphate/cardiolipin synthase-like enzyme
MRKFILSLVVVFALVGCSPAAEVTETVVEDSQAVTTPMLLNTEEVRQALFYHVVAAQETIELGTMGFSSPDLADLLLEQMELKPELKVTITTPSRYETTEYSKTADLEEAGAEIRIVGGKNLYHEKWAVFDSKVAMVMTSNLTDRGLFFNYEIGVIFPNSPDIVTSLQDHATAVWEGNYVPADPFREPVTQDAEPDDDID